MRARTLALTNLILVFCTFAIVVAGQEAPARPTAKSYSASPLKTPSSYLLGPNDQITLLGPEAEEIVNKLYRVDQSGEISLPMIGRIKVAGRTIREFEEELNKRLGTYVRDPQVVVTVTEFRSQPVSVVGAVTQPGTYQLQGRKTLIEILSLAGGLRPDAGHSVRISRTLDWGIIPLPGASLDPSGTYSVAQVSVRDILEAKIPAENIQILPNDVITVPRAELVYVIGDVRKSGGFVLGDRESMTVLQALSLAEGVERTADTRHGKILRLTSGESQRIEIAVDVKQILAGKSKDVPLRGGDILFLPGSAAKRAGLRTTDAIINVLTGIAVWGR